MVTVIIYSILLHSLFNCQQLSIFYSTVGDISDNNIKYFLEPKMIVNSCVNHQCSNSSKYNNAKSSERLILEIKSIVSYKDSFSLTFIKLDDILRFGALKSPRLVKEEKRKISKSWTFSLGIVFTNQ